MHITFIRRFSRARNQEFNPLETFLDLTDQRTTAGRLQSPFLSRYFAADVFVPREAFSHVFQSDVLVA